MVTVLTVMVVRIEIKKEDGAPEGRKAGGEADPAQHEHKHSHWTHGVNNDKFNAFYSHMASLLIHLFLLVNSLTWEPNNHCIL